MNETYQKFNYFKLPLRVFELSERVKALESGGTAVTWGSITGKPTTFPPTIGTTATTAKAGNYVPTWAEITSKPTTFAPSIGTTATTAKAGNYAPTAAEVLTAIQAMNTTQKDAVKTALGIA